jgi:hypothetical protein
MNRLHNMRMLRLAALPTSHTAQTFLVAQRGYPRGQQLLAAGRRAPSNATSREDDNSPAARARRIGVRHAIPRSNSSARAPSFLTSSASLLSVNPASVFTGGSWMLHYFTNHSGAFFGHPSSGGPAVAPAVVTEDPFQASRWAGIHAQLLTMFEDRRARARERERQEPVAMAVLATASGHTVVGAAVNEDALDWYGEPQSCTIL